MNVKLKNQLIISNNNNINILNFVDITILSEYEIIITVFFGIDVITY